jgi:hypothetical protein
VPTLLDGHWLDYCLGYKALSLELAGMFLLPQTWETHNQHEQHRSVSHSLLIVHSIGPDNVADETDRLAKIREFALSRVVRNRGSLSRTNVTLPDVVELQGRKYFSTEIFPNDVEALDG